MKRFTAVLALVAATAFADIGVRTVYHNLLRFESDIDVVDWDVDTSNLSVEYVIETIDSAGRVVMLQLMHRGKLMPQTCDIIPVYTYEYFDDRIVQRCMRTVNKVFTEIECGTFQKTVYFLEKGVVTRCLNFHTDLSFLRKPSKKDTKNYEYFYNDMMQYKKGRPQACLGIIGYAYSMAKYGGRDPGKNRIQWRIRRHYGKLYTKKHSW